MIGWHELVETVAVIQEILLAEEQAQAGILTGNYDAAGAINLYGCAYGLPTSISGIDSYWLRGYGDTPPQVLIVIGETSGFTGSFFESCTLAGHTSNLYGIQNDKTRDHPVIFVCRKFRTSWPEF